MAERSRRARAGRARLVGRRRGAELASRLGAALREARRQAGLTQAQIGADAGVSQGWVSNAEHGKGATGSIETWAALAAATELQLAAFLEHAPRATPPRDLEHLRREQAVIARGRNGGWTGTPEHAVITGDGRQRFVDVLLDRAASMEILVVEVVDFFADVGDDLRGLERKVEAVRAVQPDRRVAGLLVLRATNRNRRLVRELATLLGSRFTSGRAWLQALDGLAPLPDGDGILWSGSQSAELSAVRVPGVRPGSPPARRSPRRERGGR